MKTITRKEYRLFFAWRVKSQVSFSTNKQSTDFFQAHGRVIPWAFSYSIIISFNMVYAGNRPEPAGWHILSRYCVHHSLDPRQKHRKTAGGYKPFSYGTYPSHGLRQNRPEPAGRYKPFSYCVYPSQNQRQKRRKSAGGYKLF